MPIEGLRDALGHRAKVGILVPATNTIVEPELAAMQPPGVTNHVSRMGRLKRDMVDLDQYRRVLGRSLDMEQAIDVLAACEPDIVVHGHFSIRSLRPRERAQHAATHGERLRRGAGRHSIARAAHCTCGHRQSPLARGPYALYAARRRGMRRLLHRERLPRRCHQGIASPLGADIATATSDEPTMPSTKSTSRTRTASSRSVPIPRLLVWCRVSNAASANRCWP